MISSLANILKMALKNKAIISKEIDVNESGDALGDYTFCEKPRSKRALVSKPFNPNDTSLIKQKNGSTTGFHTEVSADIISEHHTGSKYQ